ncbi:lipoprotein-releasing system ATP-binding protein [Thermotomaculum hydrothermale]|uniref:Lipoprotein-releasing system ATP-binding protein n=1 Tax=Thermotomaculum hydrothermale TaxID=981385 RepID=A0A7R6PEC9_9BACT|nr:ABC transporter ATP-binding protein [Thermotomaculum hydrothermale]BBB32148.1 lipoprotein-releasing system ATP-binding protein [Thermotomaculum hydrothermale]
MSKLLKVDSISKSYKTGNKVLKVLENISFDLNKGEFLAITGVSGVGKSTLLNLVGLLDKPDSGEIELGNVKYSSLTEDQKSTFRNKHLGFVFQFHHLLPEFTVIENIAMPFVIGNGDFDKGFKKAEMLAKAVGLGERLEHFPTMLSGGEQQRVAVARAIVNNPDLLLMDEPTGNLDPKTGKMVMDYVFQLRNTYNLSCIIVTHNIEIAKRCDKIFSMETLECNYV